MNRLCPACHEPVPAGAYRCKTCRAVCSYRNFFRSARVICVVLTLIIAAGTWRFIIPWWKSEQGRDYSTYKEGVIIPDAVTRAYLRLVDKNWVAPGNHIRGKLLHLHHKRLVNEHAILFVHGWNGDYLSTWGDVGQMIQDPRLNRIYDFVFYGYDTGLKKYVPLRDQANGLRDEITRLEARYKTVSIVSHSKGGLVTLRAILDRHSGSQNFRLHKVLMFAPPSVNLFLDNLEWVKKLGRDELSEMRAGEKAVVAELDLIHKEVDAIMAQSEGHEEKERFRREFLNKLSIIHGGKDRVVDFHANAKTVYQLLVDDPTGASRYTLLPEFGHVDIVKIGSQREADFLHQFTELVVERLGRPPALGHVDREQIAQNTREWVANKLYEMNRMVLQTPRLGLVWKDVETAIKARHPEANGARDEFIKQVYYIYIFLDMYAKMKELESPSGLKSTESPLKEWRRDWIPQLVRSETGRWMLQNELFKYYDSAIRAEIEEATRFSTKELIAFVNRAAEKLKTAPVDEVFAEFKTKGTMWNYGETYLFVVDNEGKVRLHSAEPQRERSNITDIKDADGRQFLKATISGMSDTLPNGWAFYRFHKPGEKQPYWKASYLTRVTASNNETFVIGSGVYKSEVDVELLMQMVDRAAGMIENQGESAFAAIRDPKGPFVYAETSVVVADKFGKCIASANSDFAREGADLALLKDADGRSIGQRLMDSLQQSPSHSAWDACLWNKPRSSQTATKLIYARRATLNGGECIVAAWMWE